ncbi:transcription termination factor NusA [Fimbriiglobus ruber]|uniref:Transcription termination/antitermination protein NusA n=1 Tax=Fimbriiglobus ruber TaxID=1908690 RepID=A0A225D4L8_9BACT|nr:transcription termination factor NusA [Fimbriiglobus ruber]OWK35883.1 Transcription termination protein NusA [Fimbriiglobus ruber]
MAVAKKEPPKEQLPSKADIGKEVLKLVDLMHEEKKISRDVIFGGIEAAIQLAAERHFGVEEGIHVQIDRATGEISARKGTEELNPVVLGRIAAQSAKQVMIQKIREAESDTVFNEFTAKKGELVVGVVQRVDAGTAIVSLGKSEALLPRSEQIPGESHHVGERVKSVIFEVRKTGHRVKIVLSRAHPDFVKALFEEEIPEIDDRTIDIRAVAREAGYRSKVAVSSIDLKVDCVGACVGVRGSRIKNIIEELNGERIDIVRWNDSLQVLVPNALQPAQISDVFTYPRLGRAIVLVTEDQLSLAIGRRGQNVRLASKLVGMDIEIMTHDELGEALERAERWFGQLPHSTPETVQTMIEEGFLSYNELTFIDAEELIKFTGLNEEQAAEVIDYAEEYADTMDRSAEEERAAAAEAVAAAEAAAEAAEAGGEASESGDEGANSEGVVVSNTSTESEGGELKSEAEASGESEHHPDTTYHEGMPTDTQAIEEARVHETERTGEDGEETTPSPDETTQGPTA